MSDPAAGDPSADIALVCMPYASLSRPSMALGLLSAALRGAGLDVTALYPNFWFAEQLGLGRYQQVAGGVPTELLVGEWTFRTAAFGPDPDGDERFLDRVLSGEGRWLPATDAGRAAFRRRLCEARDAATDFVDDAARRVLGTGASVVGCTSTFEQHVPSLALLRRIHDLAPDVLTVLGGANCETDMGAATHRNFPWVDYLVSGEADGLIVPLMSDLLTRGRDIPVADLPRGVMGPAHRRLLAQVGGTPPARAMFRDLDRLPCPDFDDYFRTLEQSRLLAHIRPGLPLETSRGCWWGAKHQCTFCGLNGSSLVYDSKAPASVLAEVHALEERYDVRQFEVVDNILDTHYFTSVLPELARDGGRSRRLFVEVKANLTREQVRALVDAGVTWVQPGIESLDSGVLALMDKGVQGWQNVQLLKWAREFGLRMSWSILWGFPGESDDAYAAMARSLPLLEHLQPPAATVRLRYDRYSVYFHEAVRRGLQLTPTWSMGHVYPLPETELQRLAYFFDAFDDTDPAAGKRLDRAAEIASRPGLKAVIDGVTAWSTAFAREPAQLVLHDHGTHADVLDTRRCARSRTARLTGVERAVLLACGSALRRGRVAERAASFLGGHRPTEAEVDAALRLVIDAGLVLELDDRLLTLALPAMAPLAAVAEFPGGSVSLEPLDPLPRSIATSRTLITTR